MHSLPRQRIVCWETNVEFQCGSAEGLSVEAAVNLDLSARGQDEGVRVPICRPKPLAVLD